jgi:hypothetical protein
MKTPARYADNIVEMATTVKLKIEIRTAWRFANISKSKITAEAAKQIINGGPPQNMAIIEPIMPTNELAPKRPTAHAMISNGKKAAKS